MKKHTVIAVAGGDLRNVRLANALAEKKPGCKIYGMFFGNDVKLSEKLKISDDVRQVFPQSDIIILPLPALSPGGTIHTPLCDAEISWQDCLDYIRPGTLVAAGKVSEEMLRDSIENRFELTDYLAGEEFAVLNAVPTAEGAIEIALREMPITLHKATCMIVGYGRISKVLTGLLKAFGARVLVAARKHSDLAWAEIAGAEPVHITQLDNSLRDIDVLFNTVPAVILDGDKLEKLSGHCLVIDLASKPGGVDFQAAKLMGIKTVWALSLPGKTAPVSAGDILLATINNIIAERGYT
ncbi:MAG: dipicolinate synthase subunit DpsA [Oscillospiraceae bacterium]|nr:dipicolinate synthase subunit DpsA [Oscillospiraceae bacterium]